MPRRERPLDTEVNPLVEFAAQLRELRQQSGNLPYRELAKRAHFSATTLSEAAGGRKLPSLQVTLAYVRACYGNPEDWERRWRSLAADLPTEPVDDTSPPYVGLGAFQQTDADRFYGRDELIAELLDRLSARRFLGVFGPSGSGKSSLLRAGLAARLPGPCVIFTPGAHPLAELATQLSPVVGKSADELRAEFVGNPFVPHLRIRQAIATELVLIVDQFEELFTLCRDPHERTWFIEALVAAATDPASRTKVVLGVRADFYGHCGRHPQLVTALRDAQLLVGPMTTDELRLAITAPAEHAGCRVETALVARLIADATGQPGVLPLVSHALLQTWFRRRGTTLTLAGYEAAGGIEHALAQSADAVYAALNPGQQQVAKQVFLRLIALGEGTEDTKRRTSLAELDHSDPDTAVVVDQLTEARLITIDHDSVEITHEALIRHWPRLQAWLAEDRHGQEIHRHLTDATNSWEAVGRDPDALYRGTRLTIAQDWAARTRPALTPRENDFLTSSAAARAGEQAAALRRTRRLRRLVALLVVLLVLAVVSVVIAVDQSSTLAAQQKATQAQALVAKAATLDAQPDAAMLLTLAAYRLDPSPETRSALLSAQASPFVARLRLHDELITNALFSPDGRTLVTMPTNSSPRAWDLASRGPGATVNLPRPGGNGWTVHPNGQLAAAASGSRAVVLWDIKANQEIAKLKADQVHWLVFNPDGRTLTVDGETDTSVWDVATRQRIGLVAKQSTPMSRSVTVPQPGSAVVARTNYDGHVTITDVKAGREVARLATGRVSDMAYSPDGRTLATATDNGIDIWDTNGYQKTTTLPEPRESSSITFLADNKSLAAAGRHTTTIWDLATRRQSLVLAGHTDRIYRVFASPVKPMLATVSFDGTLVVWDLAGPVVTSHPAEPLTRVALRPDGQTVATSSANGTITLRDAATRRETATLGSPSDPLWAAAFSPDGRTLGTVDQVGNLRRWDVSSLRELPRLGGAREVSPYVAKGQNNDVAFSADSRLASVVGDDSTVRIFELPSGQPLAILPASGGAKELAFSPIGQTVATVGPSGPVSLWDTTTYEKTASIEEQHGKGTSIAFSPDGTILAVGGTDYAITLYDAATRRQLGRLTGHSGAVNALTFAPDGRTLASASDDKTVKIWDVRSQAKPLTLSGHTDAVLSLVFSSDGTTLATSSRDTTLRFWDLRVDQVADRLCGKLHDQISSTQWSQLVPDLPVDTACS